MFESYVILVFDFCFCFVFFVCLFVCYLENNFKVKTIGQQ